MIQAIAVRLVAIVFLLAVVLKAQAWAAEGEPSDQPQDSFNASAARPAENEAVERLLDKTVSFDSGKIVINGLVAFLAQQQIDMVLDYRALEDAGIGSDTPLRPLAVSEISLRSVLDLLLECCDLTYFVRDGKLLITTTDVASNELVVRIYPAADLVRRRDPQGGQSDDYDSLIELITTTVRPNSWQQVGGPGSISEFQGTLVFSQTQDVHAEIAQLLTALRACRAQQMAGNAPEPIWAESAADRAARLRFVARSTEAADFEFVERPLHEATRALAERFGVQIVLDLKALEEAGIGSDTPVTAELRKVTLPVALDLVLRPLDMTHVLKDEVILLTTTDVASQELSSVVYPVADLVQYGPPQVGVGRQYFDELIGLITTNVQPDSWDEVGGPATVCELGSTSSLVISQTREPHDEIIRLLAGLRQAALAAGATAGAKRHAAGPSRP